MSPEIQQYGRHGLRRGMLCHNEAKHKNQPSQLENPVPDLRSTVFELKIPLGIASKDQSFSFNLLNIQDYFA
jgi:hypothetical protein